MAAAAKAQELGTAELRADYATKIEGLLFSLDELNQSLMMNFRGAYVAYTTDPCGNGAMLNRQVENILREQHRFQLVRVQIRALVSLAGGKGNSHDKIMDAFQRSSTRSAGRSPKLRLMKSPGAAQLCGSGSENRSECEGSLLRQRQRWCR